MARKMKDSGIAWIGEIPEEWNIAKVKHHFRVISGATPKSENHLYWDGKIPWVTPADYKTHDKFVSHGIRYLTREGYDSCATTLVPTGSIIFSKRAPVGTVALARNELCTNQGCLSCVANDNVDMTFYYYVMSSCTEQFELVSTGTTFKEISLSVFSNFVLPSPSLDEQRRIAAFLDDKCAHIDAVIEKTRAVTKGLRQGRKMKDSGIEWIGEIPEEWEVSRHKHIMHKEKNICEHYTGEDIISLTMNGVIIRDLDAGGKMPATFDGYQYVEPENLLLCLFDIDVTPRCVGLVKNYGITSPAYSRFVVHYGYFNAYYDYLLRALDDKKVFVHLSKNLRSSLTETDFGALKTIVPPLPEQQEIAAYLDAKTAAIDRLIAKKEQLAAEMESCKKSLIYEVVTGKREVPA